MTVWTVEKIDERKAKAGSPLPTLFGAVVLDIMRDRDIADASELGLERLDLRALRRHFDGDRALHRRWLCANVASALEATDPEMGRMSLAWMG